MKQTCWKRLGAAMLTFTMVLSVVPSVGFAVDAPEQATEVTAAQTDTDRISAEWDESFSVDIPEQTEETAAQSDRNQSLVQSDESLAADVPEHASGEPQKEPEGSAGGEEATGPDSEGQNESGYQISVEGGYAAYYEPNQGMIVDAKTAPAGTLVYLYADEPEGMAFSRWVIEQGEAALDDIYRYDGCPFVMPAEDVTIRAEFVPVHQLTMEGDAICVGRETPDGIFYDGATAAACGDKIYITFDRIPEGMDFSRWVVKQGHVELENPMLRDNTFIMPDEDVVIGVEYKPTGWCQNDIGRWYVDETGSYVTGWQIINGDWYYFSGNGYMQTGWQQIGSHWFYLDENGHMQTGWQQIGDHCFYLNGLGHMLTGWQMIDGIWHYFNGIGHMLIGWQMLGDSWYYFDDMGQMQTGWQEIGIRTYYFYENGTMAVSTTIDGKYINASGIWVEHPELVGWHMDDNGRWYIDDNGDRAIGWCKVADFWYHFDAQGYMQTGWQEINGFRFHLDQLGRMTTGWLLQDGEWCYLDADGHLTFGWQEINGAWYYLDENGHALMGWQEINGFKVHLDQFGRMTTGWLLQDGEWYYLDADGHLTFGWQLIHGTWYYLDECGRAQMDWQLIDGVWYYLDQYGRMQTGWQQINGIWFYLNGSGHMTTGWQQVGGFWFYLDQFGHMTTGWQLVSDAWYYLDASGHMLTDWQWVDNKYYYFTPSGSMDPEPFVWPCSSTEVSSYFGYRHRPTAGASSFHSGIDIGAFSGSDIYAAASGTVLCAGYNSYRGYYIEIGHGSGMKTVYMHCKALYVSAGDQVVAGQHIAAVGRTGIATGSHLHFGLMVNDVYQDPMLIWGH